MVLFVGLEKKKKKTAWPGAILEVIITTLPMQALTLYCQLLFFKAKFLPLN